jgi:poly-gamma-glutamate synthesis protein (capsule biosynthesis protein)
MLARLVDATLSRRGPEYVWGDVLPLLASADLCLVNLECVIAESGAPFVPKRVFYFRAGPRAIDALRVAGIDYVSLANNHAMDYQAPALLETLQRLDRARIAHAGAGASLAEAERPALLEAGGVKVAVVAFADHFDLYAASRNEPGTNVIQIATEGASFQRVRRALQRARDTGADLVVFSIHWGPNMREEPPPEFIEFARATIDAGADIFHGHSAHVFQGIEIYGSRPIFYDTGDLVDDYAVDDLLRNDRQLLFIVEASRGGVHAVELVPLFISDMQVNRARGEDFDAVFSRLRRLSTPMGTRIDKSDGRLSVTRAAAR